MKATWSALLSIVVSCLAMNAVSAQYPPVPAAGPPMPGYAAPAGAPCADGSCASCGKHGLLGKLGLHKDCAECGGGKCNHGCGLGGKLGLGGGCGSCGLAGKLGLGGACGACGQGGICGWFCKSMPNNAPMLRKAEYPLGFPTHPYVRSPRDYFMYPYYLNNSNNYPYYSDYHGHYNSYTNSVYNTAPGYGAGNYPNNTAVNPGGGMVPAPAGNGAPPAR